VARISIEWSGVATHPFVGAEIRISTSSGRKILPQATRLRSCAVSVDGIARTISFDARYGAGVARPLVLGGGGVVFVAWLTAYLGDRRAMDGGVSGTGIHADLVAGAWRALVFPIVGDVPEGRMTMTPGGTDREIAALRASGTEVEVRHTRLPLTTNLMEPAEVPAALALGESQAAEDAPALCPFWQGG
jgi:hypothetical protein